METTQHSLMATLLAITVAAGVVAAPNDWGEGTSSDSDGATRDYYNRAALLKWQHRMGDWRDAENAAQGDRPFATATVKDDDTVQPVEWDVTALVRLWVNEKFQNQGLFLREISGSGSFHFRSREYKDEKLRPQLVITTSKGDRSLELEADTYLEPSTYRGMGDADVLKVSKGSHRALLRFDLSGLPKGTTVQRAVLRMVTFAQYGNTQMTIGVFRCSQGHDDKNTKPITGLAAKFPNDRDIESDANVLFASDFESDQWAKGWTHVAGQLDVITKDDKGRFKPLLGRALRVKIGKGTTTALNTTYQFQKEEGDEPTAIYFRYYLRLANDWNQTVQGGKLPGISGTYGKAGWGGRRSHGNDGWSARGLFTKTIPKGNPLAGRTPVGFYCYHADMKGQYGEHWVWQIGYRGYLENNRWYCLEQYVKLNKPDRSDGVLRAWVDGRLAFEKTDVRFRSVDKLKIEQIWMNVYHGGTRPSPYDQHLFIDNVVIARRYIGPMRRVAP